MISVRRDGDAWLIQVDAQELRIAAGRLPVLVRLLTFLSPLPGGRRAPSRRRRA